MTVKVADVEDLMLWQIRMFYNGNIINATRWFEPTWDLEYVFYNKTTLVGEYLSNNSVMVGAILFPSPPGQEPFYGSGKLCIIEFEVVSVPPEGEVHSCSLNINNEDTFLWDSSCSDIPAVKENGHYELRSHLLPSVYVIGMLRVIGLTPGEKSTLTFTWNTTDATVGDYLIYAMASMVQYETDREDNTFYDGIVTVKSAETIVRDIAIVNVTIPFNVVYQGWVVSVNVTVANLGNGTETFSVTLYYSNTVIATENVQNLDPNATLTLSFNWNTTSVPYHHNYTIKAVASIVSGEANTENNIFAYGLVEIRMMGDVNGDGKVDMSDIGIVCFAFGASPDHPRWNPTCDLDQNGIIDLRDIGLTAKHFGEIR
uniref:CARDB domain-containing protein n=1 Tax=candidate division WWE3 bacterium TaxID=2053526 RepID=A0A7C4TPZ4_UNCKA